MNPQQLADYLKERLPEPVSDIRMKKLIWFCDWKSCIEYGETMTNAEHNFSGSINDRICTCDCSCRVIPIPTLKQEAVIDHVLKTTTDMTWTELVRLSNSCYPVRTGVRNLPLAALLYAKEKEDLGKISNQT